MKKQSNDKEIVKLFLALFLILIVAFATGYLIRSKAKPKVLTEESNGFKFVKVGNTWFTTIKNPIINQEYNVEFRYSPSQVKNITVTGDPNKFFRLLHSNDLTAAYFTFNPQENLTFMNVAGADLAKFLKVINDVTLVAACTVNETDSCHTRPIVTCQNQENKSLVIYLKPSDEPKISMIKNCLTVEGKGEGLIKAYTKLLFVWYNIL